MGLVAPWHVGSSRSRAGTRVPCLGRRILNHCATREVPLFFFFNKFIIYFWLLWVFVAARGLSLVEASTGFSLQWLLLLQSTGSRHAGFSSCGVWAQ